MNLMEREPDHGNPHPPRPPASEGSKGVDVTLIRWMLSLTPEERLRVLQERTTAIEAVQEAGPRWTSGRS